METKVSKAQLDVWAWKEKAYEQVKDLPPGERIRFIQEQTKQWADRLRKRNSAEGTR